MARLSNAVGMSGGLCIMHGTSKEKTETQEGKQGTIWLNETYDDDLLVPQDDVD